MIGADLPVVAAVSLDWSVAAVMMAVPLAVVGVLVLAAVVMLALNLIVGVVVAAVRTAESIAAAGRSRNNSSAGH